MPKRESQLLWTRENPAGKSERNRWRKFGLVKRKLLIPVPINSGTIEIKEIGRWLGQKRH